MYQIRIKRKVDENLKCDDYDVKFSLNLPSKS